MKKRLVLVVLFLLVWASASWADNVIQTQMSTDGMFEASLIRAKVKGEVLTFQVIFKSISSKSAPCSFHFGDVYYTDTKEKKKYFGLKDTNGCFIAGPADNWISGGRFRSYIKPQGKRIFWTKFPAPPATTESIDLYIPGFLPFEDVKIAR